MQISKIWLNFRILAQYYRLHTCIGTIAYVYIACLLAGKSLFSVNVQFLAIVALLLHCYAFGQNNYFDRFYDSPIHTINPVIQIQHFGHYKAGIYGPLILLFVIVIPTITVIGIFFLLTTIILIYLYNYYSKKTVLSRIFPPFATSSLFLYSYTQFRELNVGIILWVSCLFFLTINLFIYGDLKDWHNDLSKFNIVYTIIDYTSYVSAKNIIRGVLSISTTIIYCILFIVSIDNNMIIGIISLFFLIFSLFIQEGIISAAMPYYNLVNRNANQIYRFINVLMIFILIIIILATFIPLIELVNLFIFCISSYILICRVVYNTWLTPVPRFNSLITE